MAAEKLTTGRLVQILVVMAVLITAFIWRTVDYSKSANVPQCILGEHSCAVEVNGVSAVLSLEYQGDNDVFVRILISGKPDEIAFSEKGGNTLIPEKIATVGEQKRAYFYALPKDVKYASTKVWLLNIDHDQLEVKF